MLERAPSLCKARNPHSLEPELREGDVQLDNVLDVALAQHRAAFHSVPQRETTFDKRIPAGSHPMLARELVAAGY